jgi:LPXTG-motif cell wall-anchored protein
LPATGSNNDVLVVLAFALLATGLVIVARRRVTYTNS